MKQLKELTIMTPNKPGKLAQVLNTLAKAKLNLLAIDSSSGYDLNLVRLIASDARKTKSLLAKLGYQVTETAVLAVTITDRPGQLARLTMTLGKAGVNIEYMYATAAQMDREALVAIHISDFAKGDRASMSVGLECRVPLLDHRVAEFMARQPEDFRVRGVSGGGLRQGHAECVDGSGVKRVLARYASNSVRAEKLLCQLMFLRIAWSRRSLLFHGDRDRD